MTKPLENKIALVTGASKGIGKAIALRLAADGAEVIINYNTDQKGAEAVAQEIIRNSGKAHVQHGDISKVKNISQMFSEIDTILSGRKLDILVNNAGTHPRAGFEDATEDAFDQIFNVNAKGLFFVTQEAAKRLMDGGRIVNISSVGSHVISLPSLGVYSASKGAVDTLTRVFAAALGKRNITCNAVNPGVIAPEGFDIKKAKNPNPVVLDIIKDTVLGRSGEASDVADIVAFLCGNDSRWITGQTVEASGGWRL